MDEDVIQLDREGAIEEDEREPNDKGSRR